METNMGKVDRIIRVVLALVIAALFQLDLITGFWGYAMIAIAAIFLLTSFVSFCPLYKPLGINTCKK